MGKGDNMPQFIVLLSADTINRAEEIGNEWGAQEAELWREAHGGQREHATGKGKEDSARETDAWE